MSTTTITAATASSAAATRRRDGNLASENERFLRCCADIANALIEDHEAVNADPRQPKKDLNLNSLRARYAKKHKVGSMPPLTAIIAAVPEHYKKYILPKLVAKPIRKSHSLCTCAFPSLAWFFCFPRQKKLTRSCLGDAQGRRLA